MNFSIEIGPHTDIETLPQINDVYVTLLPGGDYTETSQKAGSLVKKGFNAIPHFPARSMLRFRVVPLECTLSRDNLMRFHIDSATKCVICCRFMPLVVFAT